MVRRMGLGVGLDIPIAFCRRIGDSALWKGVGIFSALVVSVLAAPLLSATSSVELNLICVQVALTGACIVYGRNMVKARWQRHRAASQVTRHLTCRARESVELLDLLMWRFSGDEIERLSVLQLRHREPAR